MAAQESMLVGAPVRLDIRIDAVCAGRAHGVWFQDPGFSAYSDRMHMLSCAQAQSD